MRVAWAVGLLIGVSLLAVGLAGPSAAANAPRFKLKPGLTKAQAVATITRRLNRTVGFSGGDCWLYEGNARIGWRHGACVGNYTYAGTSYRFKITYTPISCSKERYVLVVPGVTRQSKIIPWKHDTFICGH